MINYLHIEHFKSIERLHVDLEPVTVLVGANGSGKSNFVDAIRLVKDAIAYDLDRAISDRHGIDSIRQWSKSRPYHVTIEIGLTRRGGALYAGEGKYSFTLSSAKGQYRVERETGEWKSRQVLWIDSDNVEGMEEAHGKEVAYDGDGDPYVTRMVTTSFTRDASGTVTVIHAPDGDASKTSKAKTEYSDDLFLGQATPYHGFGRTGLVGLSGLRAAINEIETYSIFPNTLRQPQPPMNESVLSSNGSNITSIFKLMGRSKAGSEAKAEIIESLKLIMPSLDNIVIRSVAGLLTPVFRVIEEDETRHDYNVSQISDGTMRVLGLLTALYQPHRPDVIAIEEPEQTINPAVLSVVAESIKDVGSNSQIIVTTHSPNFIDNFKPDQIRAVDLVGNLTKVSPIRKSQQQAVRDKLFTLGELMDAEGLTGQLDG